MSRDDISEFGNWMHIRQALMKGVTVEELARTYSCNIAIIAEIAADLGAELNDEPDS